MCRLKVLYKALSLHQQKTLVSLPAGVFFLNSRTPPANWTLIKSETCLLLNHRRGKPFSQAPYLSYSTTSVKMSPKKVCIIGSGNWGSAIAKLVGKNTANNPNLFVKETPMWVFEEMVNGRKLTEIINTGILQRK